MKEKFFIGWKLLPYSFNLKINIVAMILTIAMGIAMEIFQIFEGACDVFMDFGGFFLVMGGMFLGQMITSSAFAALVQTSPYKRQIHIHIPIAFQTVSTCMGFTVAVFVHVIMAAIFPKHLGIILTQILAVAVCAGIFQIYAAIAYKYFALSVCALCAMMAILGELFTETNVFIIDGNWATILICSYVIILLGGAAAFFVGKLLYKRPLSKYAFGAAWKWK